MCLLTIPDWALFVLSNRSTTNYYSLLFSLLSLILRLC